MDTLVCLALLPGILIIIYIIRKDKVEKEPRGLVLKLVLFGALSCLPAIFFETFMEGGMPINANSFQTAVYDAFLVAALCEEICKFGLMFLGSWWSKAFNYRFDGIVYGVCVAVGFAMLENVEYVLAYGFETAIVRAFLAVPLHAFCGVFMGVFYSYMKKASIDGRPAGVIGFLILTLGVPMLIHGVYDTMAMWGIAEAQIGLLVFVVILYIVGIAVIRKMSREDFHAGLYSTGANFSEGAQGTAYAGAKAKMASHYDEEAAAKAYVEAQGAGTYKYATNFGSTKAGAGSSGAYAKASDNTGYAGAASGAFAGQSRPSITVKLNPTQGLRTTTCEVLNTLVKLHPDVVVDNIMTGGESNAVNKEMPLQKVYHSAKEFDLNIDKDFRKVQMANPDQNVDFSSTVSKVVLPYSTDFLMNLNYELGQYYITLTAANAQGILENAKILFELEQRTSITIDESHRQALYNWVSKYK